MNEEFLYCKIEYPADITISLFEYSSILYNTHLLFRNAIEFERKRSLKRSELDELKPKIKSIRTGSLETIILSLAGNYAFLKLLRMNLTEIRQILSELRQSLDEFSKIIEKISSIKQSSRKNKELEMLRHQLFEAQFLLNKKISTVSYLRNLATAIAKISPLAKIKFSISNNYNNIGKETFIIDKRTKYYIEEYIEKEIIYSDEITASILIEELDHRTRPFKAKIFILDQSLNLLIKSQEDFERLKEYLGTQKPLKVKLRFIINIRDFTKINRAELIDFI